ncbi:MAG: hypothetical protein IKF82_00510 [Bacilli bacterium]|nr:hypothetical protein [Bacilli bacterium]
MTDIQLIRPPIKIISQLEQYITDYQLESRQKELYYHFNIGDWCVNLADTKDVMINYDFTDLVSNFQAKLVKEDGDTNKDFLEKQRAATEILRNNFLNLYQEFRHYVIEQLTPIVKEMGYTELFQLFTDTWGEAPFKLNYLLEDMFLFFGDKSMIQNVVGDSGTFKSTRSMIEFNSLPAVFRIDDATVAGISRDSQTKGTDYLDNTVVYYNDVGDSTQMQQNFKDCLQTIYKKLFSEGAINRSIAMKNSDKTLRLELNTPSGFKLKFNSVKPVFNEDDGQTESRIITINLPSYTPEESIDMILSGRFGVEVYSQKDPRIFKDVLQVYYQTRDFKSFDPEFIAELAKRCNEDNNDVVNWHKIKGKAYVHQEMRKLYGEEFYKDKYFNRVMINTSMLDQEEELYNIIKDGLDIAPWDPIDLDTYNDMNKFTVAKTKSASIHKNKYNYDSFTVRAVKGIRKKFIENNKTKISLLLKSMEEHGFCEKVGMLGAYNVYVLLPK